MIEWTRLSLNIANMPHDTESQQERGTPWRPIDTMKSWKVPFIHSSALDNIEAS